MNNKKDAVYRFFGILIIAVLPAAAGVFPTGSDEPENSRSIISYEMSRVLENELRHYYPSAVDTLYGGFLSDFNSEWKAEGKQDKMIVTQARYIWTAANAAVFFHDTVYLNFAAKGVEFLKDKMWDQENGGFYEFVDREGIPLQSDEGEVKTAYGNAFAIYGLARYFAASDDSSALELAKKTFYWLEKNSFDRQYGGYFQYLARDGKPLMNGYRNTPPKDQNSSIHLLEGFTELYKVWKDPGLKNRLVSLLHIIRDTIVTKKGYMNLFFMRNWIPVSYLDSSILSKRLNYFLDHVSFGHDVETAYLILEASKAAGGEEDSWTLLIAKKMVDHVLRYGWDRENGGIFDGGYYFYQEKPPEIVRRTKEWWGQAEGLNSFLMMSDYFPEDSMNYFEKFNKQWVYCKKYAIDSVYGGWYWSGLDIEPKFKTSPKGSVWKAAYHTSRALINCIQRLHKQIERKK